MSRDDAVRAAAEAAHDAYERRAAEVGWETQARSRVAWADVPEANKRAMYAAMDAAAPHLTADLVRELDEALAEVERLRVQVADTVAVLSVAWPTTEVPWIAEVGVAACVSLLASQRDEALAEVERLRRVAAEEHDAWSVATTRADRAEAAIARCTCGAGEL
jgi:hypothetical protein